MKILNKTHWNSEQIKALLYAVARQEQLPGDFTRRLHCTIKYRRNGGYGGSAFYNSHYMKLKMPRTGPVDSVTVAKIMAHEMAHCQGVKHRQMHGPRYSWEDGWREIWAMANNYTIEAKAVVANERSLTTSSDQMEKCRLMIGKWERKAQLAKTYIKKWSRRLAYYEKKSAVL